MVLGHMDFKISLNKQFFWRGGFRCRIKLIILVHSGTLSVLVWTII